MATSGSVSSAQFVEGPPLGLALILELNRDKTQYSTNVNDNRTNRINHSADHAWSASGTSGHVSIENTSHSNVITCGCSVPRTVRATVTYELSGVATRQQSRMINCPKLPTGSNTPTQPL